MGIEHELRYEIRQKIKRVLRENPELDIGLGEAKERLLKDSHYLGVVNRDPLLESYIANALVKIYDSMRKNKDITPGKLQITDVKTLKMVKNMVKRREYRIASRAYHKTSDEALRLVIKTLAVAPTNPYDYEGAAVLNKYILVKPPMIEYIRKGGSLSKIEKTIIKHEIRHMLMNAVKGSPIVSSLETSDAFANAGIKTSAETVKKWVDDYAKLWKVLTLEEPEDPHDVFNPTAYRHAHRIWTFLVNRIGERSALKLLPLVEGYVRLIKRIQKIKR